MPARPIHEMSASPHSRRLAVATVLGIAGTAAAMYTGALDIKRDKQPQSVNGSAGAKNPRDSMDSKQVREQMHGKLT